MQVLSCRRRTKGGCSLCARGVRTWICILLSLAPFGAISALRNCMSLRLLFEISFLDSERRKLYEEGPLYSSSKYHLFKLRPTCAAYAYAYAYVTRKTISASPPSSFSFGVLLRSIRVSFFCVRCSQSRIH